MIETGIGYEELEKLARPPLIPDGSYEFSIKNVEDSPVKGSGRPQWNFHLEIINRPDLTGRVAFYRAQLPWVDPTSNQWDYLYTFGITDLVSGVGITLTQPTPDPAGLTFYGVPKEAFVGRTGVMKIGHRPRKDEPETIDNSVKIVTKKKGGGIVA